MDFTVFTPHQPIISDHLPLTLMNLDDWVIVNVTGQDSEKYLQGQVSADVTQITNYQHLLVAHCNSKGKIWSNLHLFRRGKGFSFIERHSVLSTQLNELKKYAIFSKITFTPDEDTILLGVAGFKAREALSLLFSKIPDVKKTLISYDTTSLLWFKYPTDRFIIVTNKLTARHVTEVLLSNNAQYNNSQQWLALNIEAGIPIIDLPNSGRFIPQAINLQALGGINFKKGCYIGQEMIARTKFRGINKRSLCCLIGTANRLPKVGEDLELKVEKKWCRTGIVLAAVQLNDKRMLIQASMNNDIIKTNNIFHIQDDTNILSIKSLPYSSND